MFLKWIISGGYHVYVMVAKTVHFTLTHPVLFNTVLATKYKRDILLI